MQTLIALVVGLILSALVGAEPLVEGWVRQSSGEPGEAAQVLVFDWTDLRRGVVAQATTNASGYFALPLASLGGSVLPQAWTLGQNYPNPFNPSTIIPYQMPTAASVRLEVFNVLGQRVATLVDGERSAGAHTAVWDATDAVGQAVGAGVYFYRLRSAGLPTLTRRMVLVDGQAGQAVARVPQPMGLAPAPPAEGVYGLVVTGAGFVTYVDASFGVQTGMAPVEVVVETVEGLPRGKALTDRVLGDVNGDGQVTLDDALLVMTYVVDRAVELPPNGDIFLGDVNGDGQVTLDDALLVMTYVVNPADPSLPGGIGQAVQAVSSGDGDWVAGVVHRMTYHDDWDGAPTWSPDGRHIAFESYRELTGKIYVMDVDGNIPRSLGGGRLTDYGAPTWSPDGRHIALHSNYAGNWDIYVMDADGGTRHGRTGHEARDSFPSWSPDGRHLAFESYRDGNFEIYVMDADGSNKRNLTDHSAGDIVPSWSPDGRQIAFESYRDGNFEIYVMDADGSNPRNLTDHSADDGYPTWSPDGRHLAFMSYRDGNEEIYVMDADGSNPRNLTDHSADDEHPTWSPDGRHLAFMSDRDGNEEIYMMELRQEGDSPSSDDDGETAGVSEDVGNTIDTARDWELNMPREGSAGFASLVETLSQEFYLEIGDEHFFRIQIPRRVDIGITTISDLDTQGWLLDKFGGRILYNDDDESQLGLNLNFVLGGFIEPGTYYLKVAGHENTTGPYQLYAVVINPKSSAKPVATDLASTLPISK